MKLVKEHINFERGLNPKTAMGIGKKIIQLSDETGMDLAELRMTKSRLGNLFRTGIEYRNFLFWLKIWEKDPSSHNIEINSPIYEDIIWALQYPKEAFELLNLEDSELYEHTNFKRGLDPKEAMQISDVLFRKREKIKEELRKGIKILVYDLKANKETIQEKFDGPSSIDIQFKGKQVKRDCIYFLGYNIATNNYYAGFEYPDLSDSSISSNDTIGECMNKIRWWASSK